MAGPGDTTEHIRAKQRAKDARKREYQALVAKAKKNGGAMITPPPKNKGGRPQKKLNPQTKAKLEREAKAKQAQLEREAKEKEHIAARSRLRSNAQAAATDGATAVSPASVGDASEATDRSTSPSRKRSA